MTLSASNITKSQKNVIVLDILIRCTILDIAKRRGKESTQFMSKIKTINDTSRLSKDPFLYDLQFSLREIQNSMGYTQEEISKLLHISRGHFINLENGNATLSLEIAEQILFLLARYCSRRPWEEQELLKILRKNIRPQHPEDLHLFCGDSILECWERHSPIPLPEEVQLLELVPKYELLIDPCTFPAPAIRALQPLADAMRENNRLHSDETPQKFTALQSDLEQVLNGAEKDSTSEAASTKIELERLNNDGILEVFSTETVEPSYYQEIYFHAYLSTTDFSRYSQSETAHIAVFTGSEEIVREAFRLNNLQALKKSIHLFHYDPKTKKILEWVSPDLQCVSSIAPAPSPDDFIQIGNCTYPIRKKHKS